MSRVLYIKANSKPEGKSRTFEISDAFIEAYKKSNPEDEIVILDLYKEGIGFLNLETMGAPSSPEEGKKHPILKYAYQFLDADKYVFAQPLWNLGVPAILKAYIDYVCVSGITFEYTATGAVGLCHHKKAVNITSRGGEYSTGHLANFEMGDRYLKTILTFMGVTSYQTIAAETLDVIGNDVKALVSEKISEAQEIAKTF